MRNLREMSSLPDKPRKQQPAAGKDSGKRDVLASPDRGCDDCPRQAGESDNPPRGSSARNVRPGDDGRSSADGPLGPDALPGADALPTADGRRANALSKAPGQVGARLGGAQRGAVKRAQLLAAGVSRHSVDRRAQSGDLHRKHRGVYIVGHLALAPRANEAAALLACGEGALLSHRSAAHVWSLLESVPDRVDVTLVGRRCRPKEGVRLHWVAEIDRRDVRRRDGLPLTSPARTLVDLAFDASADELDRAVSEARALDLLRTGELERALERSPGRRGAAPTRAFLLREDQPGYTRSKAERQMRRLMNAAGLPVPVANAKVAGYTADFLWREQRVIVEVDGYQFHGHRAAFERDRRKDMALSAAGYRVIRITWWQLRDEPFAVVAHIARMLERAS